MSKMRSQPKLVEVSVNDVREDDYSSWQAKVSAPGTPWLPPMATKVEKSAEQALADGADHLMPTDDQASMKDRHKG